MPEKFNFVVTTQKTPFDIKNGVVLGKKGEVVCVVHNAGHNNRLFPNGIKFEPPPKFEASLNGEFWGITVFFNLSGNKNKIKIYRKFREFSKKQGLKLLAVEAVFKNAPFELEKDDAEIIIQLRTNSILWQKERMFNEALSKLPKSCDKIVWIDCDIIFSNKNWVKETSELLQSYFVIQPFQYSIRLPKEIDYIAPEKLFFQILSMTRDINRSAQGIAFRRRQKIF